MTVLVHELCECGAEVPRRFNQYAMEVVWCPNCKREFGKPLPLRCPHGVLVWEVDTCVGCAGPGEKEGTGD